MNDKHYKFCLVNGTECGQTEAAARENTFKKSPMLWDLIKAEEFLLLLEKDGKIKSRNLHICVIYALYKLAYKNRSGSFPAPASLIAKFSGLSRRTVIRLLPQLERLGLIKIVRRALRCGASIIIINPVVLVEDNTASTTNTCNPQLPGSNNTVDQNKQLQQPQISNNNYTSQNASSELLPEKLFTTDCEQLLTDASSSHAANDSQSSAHCQPVTGDASAGHTLKNNTVQSDFYSKERNNYEKEIEKIISSIVNKTKQNKESGFKEKGKNNSQNQPDTRTAMVQINMLRKKYDETTTAMGDLIHDGSFYNDRDKQKYYELKTLKFNIIRKLNSLYELVGLDELKLPEPPKPANTQKTS
ncbi:MAG: helix-turn-helix domain-containing protein [Verrucomicrobiia bacterium]